VNLDHAEHFNRTLPHWKKAMWPASKRNSRPSVDHPSSIVYFRVGDIDSSYRELSERGVPFDDQPHLIARTPDHDLWMVFFRDPDDMAEVRPPAAR
jgi:hypothetical protein